MIHGGYTLTRVAGDSTATATAGGVRAGLDGDDQLAELDVDGPTTAQQVH